MTLHAVRYEYAIDTERTRDQHREEHVAFLRALHGAGTLIASGRLEDPTRPGALLLVEAATADAALRLLDDDPFHLAGVVADRDARAWAVAFGGELVVL